MATVTYSNRGGVVLGEIFAKNSPTGYSSVVGSYHGGHTGEYLHYLKAASSAVLTSVPQIGRGHRVFGRTLSAKLGYLGCRFGESEPLGAELVNYEKIFVIIYSQKQSSSHIKAVIKGDELPQSFVLDNGSVAYVASRGELGEELSLENVPPAMKPSVLESLWKTFKLLYVTGIALGEREIIVNESFYKSVVIRILVGMKFSVNEKPFYPSVTHSAGVACQIHTLGEIPNASQTGLKNRKLIFAQLRCLVDGYDVVFLTLVTEGVACACTVSKLDAATVGQRDGFFGVAVREQ